MSLARAFTRRSRRPEISSPNSTGHHGQKAVTPVVVRASDARKNRPSIKTFVISGPVELISTTNVLSYNAPDIATFRHTTPQTSPTSRTSSDESDSNSTATSHRSRDTLTDASSVNTSPTSSVQPHEFSTLFKSSSRPRSVRKSTSTSSISHRKSLSLDGPSPAIPQRAPSHSKRAHQQLARQRSMSQVRGSSMSSRLSREERASLDFFKGNVDPAHPFNIELEKLNEVAEELNTTVRSVEITEDEKKMLERGLARFCANDYVLEIKPLLAGLFSDSCPEPTSWI